VNLAKRQTNFPELQKIELTATSLRVAQQLTDEELGRTWEFLSHAESGMMWWIGDLAMYEEGRGIQQGLESEWYKEKEKLTGFKKQTLMNAKSVSKCINSSVRTEKLTFRHHEIIAGAFNTSEEQTEWLKKAADNKWSTRTLKNEINKAKPQPDLPEGKYQVIYADPPWAYNTEESTVEVNKHYPTMELEDICAVGVGDLAWEDCVLYLWATTARLDWAFPVIKAWGFKYLTSMIWDKVEHNLGWYCAANHEILLIAGRGNSAPEDIKLANNIDSVQTIKRSKTHSQKPKIFRDIINSLYPNKKKIELFAREKSDGWDVWGNNV